MVSAAVTTFWSIFVLYVCQTCVCGECGLGERMCPYGKCRSLMMECDGCSGVMYKCQDRCIDLSRETCVRKCQAGDTGCKVDHASAVVDTAEVETGAKPCRLLASGELECKDCLPGQKQCSNGECIWEQHEYCKAPCLAHEVECIEGSCARDIDHCPCHKYCPDDTCVRREVKCPDCPPNHIKCSDGACVNIQNGEQCTDCPGGYFKCFDGRCVRDGVGCGFCPSGYDECADGSCANTVFGKFCSECRRGYKRCFNKRCIPNNWWCRGPCGTYQVECPDGTCRDQGRACHCELTEVACDDGKCVSYLGQCDSNTKGQFPLAYLTIPVVFVILAAPVAAYIGSRRHKLNFLNKSGKTGSKSSREDGIKMNVFKEVPSHFPVPVDARDVIRPRVGRGISAASPPVWKPEDLNLEAEAAGGVSGMSSDTVSVKVLDVKQAQSCCKASTETHEAASLLVKT